MVIEAAAALLVLACAVVVAKVVDARRERRSRVAHVDGAAPVRRR
jgi:hypothetical protein